MRRRSLTARSLRLFETSRVPWDAVILGWGPMLPFPVALGLVLRGGVAGEVALDLIVLWGAAVVIFLSGVRRGLSFRTPGGWTWAQMGVFAGLFWAGLLALVLPLSWALWLLATAYLSLAVLDPIAARWEEAPLYFARLRPWRCRWCVWWGWGRWFDERNATASHDART